MSVDIEIVPSILEIPTCGKTMNKFSTMLDNSLIELIGGIPKLIDYSTSHAIKENEKLKINKYYTVSYPKPNTISLSIPKNESDIDPEFEIIEDYGRNLDKNRISKIAEIWASAGYSYLISSTGGRGEGEAMVQTYLAAAIAFVSQGFVLVTSDRIFNLSIGVYSYKEFKDAQPLF